MAKAKRGRPAKGKTEVTARIDADIMQKVKWLASVSDPRVTIGEYLSETLRPIIEKRFQSATKRQFLEKKTEEP